MARKRKPKDAPRPGRPRKSDAERWRPVLLSLTPDRYSTAAALGDGSPQQGIYRLLDEHAATATNGKST